MNAGISLVAEPRVMFSANYSMNLSLFSTGDPDKEMCRVYL